MPPQLPTLIHTETNSEGGGGRKSRVYGLSMDQRSTLCCNISQRVREREEEGRGAGDQMKWGKGGQTDWKVGEEELRSGIPVLL